jgi:hypothetical protein
MQRASRLRKTIAALMAAALAQTSWPGGLLAQTKPPAGSAAPSTAAQPAATATSARPDAAVDGGWPRTYLSAAGAQIVVYQPQVASWDGRTRLVAYAAVSYLAKGGQKPALGTVRLETTTNVAVAERLVRFSPIELAETRFPDLSKEQLQDLSTELQDGIPDDERIIALDRVLASIDASQIVVKNDEALKADPPVVFYSTRPAVLVNFDGDPIWSPIDNNDLKFAVNTNWDVFSHEPSGTFYLLKDGVWLQAASIAGPWKNASALPGSFSKLPNDPNWTDVKKALPLKASTAAPPQVYTSTTPAELILVRGTPAFVPVTGTGLYWLSNTDADVFRLGANGPLYYLVAGRWFSAASFSGPWTFATTTLPADFKKISLEHERSRVLASVPGTAQAAEAVLLAQVPQTARVNRKTIKAPDVIYNGDPQFELIPTTTVSRAVNTDKDIIKVGDLYYMCFQGVWFRSTTSNGPWEVADNVPKQIYEIPASSPSHSVTYVTVEDNDDEWVTFAAVAAYTGVMVAWGCAVWGTGYYYPPYVGYGRYPVYYPFYPTYGYGAYYNPWTGAYGRGAAWYGPYGGAGYGARYNPTTGTYARGAVAYGPGGARGYAEAYNPRTGTYARTNQGSGVYGSWGSTSVQRGNQWVDTARVTNRATGTTTRATTTSGGGAAVTRSGPAGTGGVVRTGSGDVYAGRDGNVYRNNGGSWQQYNNGSWGSVNSPTPRSTTPSATPSTRSTTPATGDRSAGAATRSSTDTVNQLNQDRAARTEGATRTRDYSSTRSTTGSSSSTRSGSYRPSGGARGGGGRRR